MATVATNISTPINTQMTQEEIQTENSENDNSEAGVQVVSAV